MRDVKYGLPAVHYPPIEQNAQMMRMYEAAGLDFALFWDNTIVGFPQSIWTPDLIPAAAHYNVDNLLDGFIPMAQAAMVTERMELIMMAVDAFRRAPTVLAQQIMGVDHLSKGRASFHIGAGEAKQFTPYGLNRDKPFGHLEEMLKVLRLLIDAKEPVNYDGQIWKMKNALLKCPPYNGQCPPLLVVGGPGKAIEFAGRLGDGWGTYLPACGSPEWYAEHVQKTRKAAEESGKDPDKLKFVVAFVCIIEADEAAVERAVNNPGIRWDTAAFIPSTETWKAAGFTNPFGDDWSYSRDLIPTEWTREAALKIIDQVPSEAVRALRICGTPEKAAEQIQPYIEAGCNYVCAVNYAGLVGAGDWAGGATGSKVMDDTFAHLRKLNGQPQPTVKG